MGQPAAKQGDSVTAVDIHMVVVPGQAPQALPHPFSGPLNGSLSGDVTVARSPAATVGSTADNDPAHTPTPPGAGFQVPPQNRATVISGSASVMINGKPAARLGDTAQTCNDPAPLPVGTVIGTAATVLIG